ncbi:MAG: allantoicase [Xanthomonadales bacterium]|nr:allantoicase [Xanthomonadales bacterium]
MADLSLQSRVNLAEPRLGAEVVYASDEFFAAKERLIDPAEPVFIPDRYDEHGKWMDGWESRRRRRGGHDHCVVRLGSAAYVEALEIDTRHFTGNYPPQASVDVCCSDETLPADRNWQPLVPRIDLEGDHRRALELKESGPWTHLRLNIFPDGGVARLRVFGRLHPPKPQGDELIDMAAILNGGAALACNDQHYGRLANILAPGPGLNMGDGWETRRRREPGHDWGVIRLARPAVLEEVLVDTAWFKGNYPDRVSLQAAAAPEAIEWSELGRQSAQWPLLLPEQTLAADCQQQYSSELLDHEPVQLVRVNLFPDGGISRLRLMGRPG